MDYSIDTLVRLAKRDNNKIRSYLYVNPFQAKHIPADPRNTFEMCKQLADKINRAYPNDRLFVIGFAETATGIASCISHHLNNVIYFQTTTREMAEGASYLYFTESHSHATDQTLREEGLEAALKQVDRVIFIDDEVTTGSTICKLIHVLKERFDTSHLHFSIASILNSMKPERKEELLQNNIECIYFANIPFEYKKGTIEDALEDKDNEIDCQNSKNIAKTAQIFEASMNVRKVSLFKNYDDEVLGFACEVVEKSILKPSESVLILGTEEFMYPAICLGKVVLDRDPGCKVRVHATTRSPIIVSSQEDYPLTSRFKLRSFYDEARTTFIYNLDHYDKVLIVTDSENEEAGLSDLITALENKGNQNIDVWKWVYHE